MIQYIIFTFFIVLHTSDQVVYKLKRSLYSIKVGEYGLEQETAEGDRGREGGASNPNDGCCLC